jgi:hypothetical protein
MKRAGSSSSSNTSFKVNSPQLSVGVVDEEISRGILGGDFLLELQKDRAETKGKFATTGAGIKAL